METIVFYISGHGFGHASRSIEVINALVDRRPDLTVIVRSAVAPWLVKLTAPNGVRLEPVECDTGVVQIDSLHLDERATIERARAFMATLPDRASTETARLEEVNAALVVADLPALGIAAADAAGIPGVAVGNFTWDWIYAAYEDGQDIADAIGDIYARTTLALRLPMWGGFSTMPAVCDVPLVARRSRHDAAAIREALGLDRKARVVLVSFGGHGTEGIDLDALSQLEGVTAVIAAPSGHARTRGNLVTLDEAELYARGFRYEDLVKAADVVVTKPGYGIIAECVANDTAILYTSRGHFVEYDVLVEHIPRYLRSGFIDHADLFAGRWARHLETVLSLPAPAERPAVNGAEVVADMLLGMLERQAVRYPPGTKEGV
jgi:predicted glycosyltransferase